MSKLVVVFWLLTAAVELLLVAQPIGLMAQLALAAVIIVALAAISLLRLKSGIWRHVFLALASIMVLRYAYWRSTSTLPPMSDLASFVPGLMLYIAEMYCIVMLAISLFVVADPKRRGPAPRFRPESAPAVDVFVPSFNESSDILALTLSAAKAMNYPADKLNVYLLDDGATDEKLNAADPVEAAEAEARAIELKALAARLGVIYHARQNNQHAKAGNLNAGLEISNGDLVVVFDADHAPERHFLEETVGYFAEDPKLFLVQTPHFFANPDPIEANLGTFSHMPSENEMFYGKIQQGLDRWNASFFCGSAAVLRREALEQAGGFSGITITEDAETALDLHARGWNSVYVDKPLITGMQPETLSAFIGQRSRWCRGMVQILMLHNPLFRRGLTLPQRIGYLSNSLFWLFPLARAMFFIAPLLLILFNLKIYVSTPQEFFAYAITYLIVGEMVRGYLYGSVRWPWISEVYEYIQSIYLLRAILSVLISPRRPTFNVTAKGERVTHDRLSHLALPYFVIFGIFSISMAVCVYRYNTEPQISSLLAVVGLWQLVNLLIAGAALGAVIERSEARVARRMPSKTRVEVTVGDEQFNASLADVSTTGAILVPLDRPSLELRRGDQATVRLLDAPGDLTGLRMPTRVAHSGDGSRRGIGVRFEPQIEDYRVIAHLMLADMEPMRAIRRQRQRPRSYIRATWNLVVWSIRSPLAAIWIAITGERGKPSDTASARPRRIAEKTPVVNTAPDVA